jgi:hypothetical protein
MARFQMTREQIEARDKRMAAIHEAAHATVAAAIGHRIRARIYFTGTSDPANEKTWAGHIETALGGGFTPAVAVAGFVAEVLDRWPNQDEDDFISMWMCGEYDELSETDQKFIPDDWDLRQAAISEALDVLRRESRLFDEITRKLIEGDVLTDGMIAELADELLTERGA